MVSKVSPEKPRAFFSLWSLFISTSPTRAKRRCPSSPSSQSSICPSFKIIILSPITFFFFLYKPDFNKKMEPLDIISSSSLTQFQKFATPEEKQDDLEGRCYTRLYKHCFQSSSWPGFHFHITARSETLEATGTKLRDLQVLDATETLSPWNSKIYL